MGTVELTSLPVATPLGKGGFAKVSDLPGWSLPGEAGTFVLKRYHPKVVEKYHGIGPALGALIDLRLRMSPQDRRVLDARGIWPLATVADGGSVVGLIMRRISDVFVTDMLMTRGDVKRMVRTIDMYFCAPESSAGLGLPPIDLPDRVMLLARFGSQLAFLHRHGVTVGDIQGGNLAVYPNGRAGPKPLMYDCDSYRLRGSVPAIPQAHAMSWEPPELKALRQAAAQYPAGDPRRSAAQAQSRVQTSATDVYKFGLLALRLLSMRDGVAVSLNPEHAVGHLRAPQLLGPRRARLFCALVAAEPTRRPTMAEFMSAVAA